MLSIMLSIFHAEHHAEQQHKQHNGRFQVTDTRNLYIPMPAPWRTVSQPRGVFRGKNMLTPTVLAYARARIDRVTLYVEVSHGSAMHWIGHDIYGLTFRRANGATPDPDPSKPVHSIEEVAETLEQVAKTWKKPARGGTP